MKVSLFKVVILVLLAVTLIYPVALHLDIQRYEAWKESYLETPYTFTSTGALLIIIGVLLGGSWLMVIVHRKKLKSATLTVLMFIVVLAFTPRAYAGWYEQTVDVLCAQDEEFRWIYPAGLLRYLGWEIYINDAFGRFKEEFGITFKVRGWIDWDSTDYAGSMKDLLDEAINETNFESQVTTYSVYTIDMLMVFTGEPAERAGYSPAPLKALIIYVQPDCPRDRLLQHELSHQFWIVGHCQNDCIMNVQPFTWIPTTWCGQCTDTINANLERFWRWTDTPDGGGGGGHIGCNPM